MVVMGVLAQVDFAANATEEQQNGSEPTFSDDVPPTQVGEEHRAGLLLLDPMERIPRWPRLPLVCQDLVQVRELVPLKLLLVG